MRYLLAIMIFTILMGVSAMAKNRYEKATFAGGCFWCMEKPFEQLKGVKEVISGYTGGEKKNPTYTEVSSGTTGHREAVQVIYDPEEITYQELALVKNLVSGDRIFC